jgi:uncharacterized repeat protein (TIGR04138 family)
MHSCSILGQLALTDVAVPHSLASELKPFMKLMAEDPRYKLDAYQFVGAGLEYAQKVLRLGKTGPRSQRKLNTGDDRPVRHVKGQDLCVALRHLAHQQYGYMAKLVLASWGIRNTSDFGEIVFNLIKIGKMSKSENDRREDFDNVYDFDQALVKDFVIAKEEVEFCLP